MRNDRSSRRVVGGSALALALFAGSSQAFANTSSSSTTKSMGNSTIGAEYRATTVVDAGSGRSRQDLRQSASVKLLGRTFTVFNVDGRTTVDKGSGLGPVQGVATIALGPVRSVGIDFDSRTVSYSRTIFSMPYQFSVGPVPIHASLSGSASISLGMPSKPPVQSGARRFTVQLSVGVSGSATAAVGVKFAHVGVKGTFMPLRASLLGNCEVRSASTRFSVEADLGWTASLSFVAKAGWFTYEKKLLTGEGSYRNWTIFERTVTADRPASSGSGSGSSGSSGSSSPAPSGVRTLRRGDTGADVRTLQSRLKQVGRDPGPIDGIFGSKTEDAVQAFQRGQGLVADGIVGPKTREALTRVIALLHRVRAI